MPGPNDNGTVTLVDKAGLAREVPAAQADELVRHQGFSYESADAAAARVGDTARAAEVGGVETALTSGLSGATLGGSDVLLRAVGGEDARIRLEAQQKYHPTIATVLSIAGALAPALLTGGATAEGSAAEAAGGILPTQLASRAGAAVREGIGGFGGAVVGGAAEGAIYGAGQGVHELALSSDPLTAEHIASTLSSNMLLGAGIGGVAGAATKGVERVLSKASDALAEASAARGAIEGLPDDLQGLDDKGLIDAAKTAKAEHAATIETEKAALEQVRVGQRAEVADQIKALHTDLATERPIFDALASTDRDALNPALKGIDGVSDARVQLAKSYRAMRTGFDSPISVARDPGQMIRPLEMRQAALETLQAKMPEIQAAVGQEGQASALAHVDDALEQTKAQLEQIRAVSKSTPLASDRLTQLTAGPSEKMAAIDAAREALKKAPELGIVGKGAKGAAFAGGTALAHMIPGVGIAAPFVGKYAADAVGKLFERASGAVGKVAGKATAAADKFLGAAKSLEPYAAPAATKVLSEAKFGPAKESGSALHELFNARTSELYQQTERQADGTTVMRPEARLAMAAKLDPIRQVNPILADKIETVQARKTAYLAQIAPKKPEPPALQIGPDNSRPPDLAIRAWARAVRAVEDPSSVEERLARGIVTPEEADAYRSVYPEQFAELQREIFGAAPMLEKTLPMNKKVALSIFTGIPVTPSMQPNVLSVLQSTFDVEPGSAGGTQSPRAQPSFGSMGSLKDTDKPTPSQERQQ